ncbi:copper homeostasis protein CutC [Criibacterium bergeronii]|uniref:Copper homeostasis protein cutC homolog n=1 Tax=Criibacterium bergeronii TaxID=1871336 RepID=A0A371IJX5_9FIRM|nr:copper homeostasis protein CutC [Criibacterium bergeronii]MBS6063803.1 copper homeostasis protein CutC [Peptostreptococcaceae bacterium]RDY20764.1 copper homeostasis protein CutC [Criibacterium bergeronii]
MPRITEIIVQSVQDAVNAQAGGSQRVELVSALSEGGLTPSIGLIYHTLQKVSIEVAIMIRPNNISFVYDKYDLEVMKKDISEIEKLDGNKRIVLGALTKEGEIDFEAVDYLIKDTKMPITFHRAIDSSKNYLKSIKELNNYKNITHILTSGGGAKAHENIQSLNDAIEISNKTIICGSGITMETMKKIASSIKSDKVYDFHIGSFAQNENQVVDVDKVKELVKSNV